MTRLKQGWLKLLYAVSAKLPMRVIQRSTGDNASEPYLEQYSLLRSSKLNLSLQRYVAMGTCPDLLSASGSVSLVLAGHFHERRMNRAMQIVNRTVRFACITWDGRWGMIDNAASETWVLIVHKGDGEHFGFIGPVIDGQASFNPAPASQLNWLSSNQTDRPERLPLRLLV